MTFLDPRLGRAMAETSLKALPVWVCKALLRKKKRIEVGCLGYCRTLCGLVGSVIDDVECRSSRPGEKTASSSGFGCRNCRQSEEENEIS